MMRPRCAFPLLVVAIAWMTSICASAMADELRAANIFTDNMVIQRDEDFVIWGWAKVGENVSVSLLDQSVLVQADTHGRWDASFKPIGLGEPFNIKIKCPTKEITLGNVVAGDVWICSGQSNMEWPVRAAGNPAEEIGNGNWPMIRHVRIEHIASPGKLDDVINSGWQVCTPQTVGDFTATGYFFGRKLHQELEVPIGLLHTSWGGTIIETWISPESLKEHADFSEAVERIAASAANPAEQERQANQSRLWQEAFRAALDDHSDEWQKPELDDSDWKKIDVPGNWESQGYGDLDGVAWYRRKFKVPAKWIGKKTTLSVAKIDDMDQTYVNGRQVGGLADWTARRKYELSADLLKNEENTIAIRVTDNNGGGGIHGEADNVFIQLENEPPISLAGQWNFKPGTRTASLGPRPQPAFNGPNHPTLLYNAMINPILPFKARGVIWYQGESNAGRAYQYRTLMPMLVNDWRDKFDQDLSFYWVQLANFMAPADLPGNSQWAELREAQTMSLDVPKTGQAVIIDIGEANDIHPKNKQDVGNRLALIALAQDYGKNIEYSGPMYKSIEIDGGKARLAFDHSEGLMSKGDKLQRFEVAGIDRKFVWADAVIDGEEVVVSSPEVPHPVAVRYAWSDNPEGCNLYNAAGLPASPFRTDNWKGITQYE